MSPRARTGGDTVPWAERQERGQRQLKLSVDQQTLDKLDELVAAEQKSTRSKVAMALIDAAHRRMLRRGARSK